MIINMEIEDISTEYAHRHISLRTDYSDNQYIEHHSITRLECRNIKIVLNLEELIKKRYILHIKVYGDCIVEINDIINLYKCIYYKEKYTQAIDKIYEKEKIFKLFEEDIQMKQNLINNYEIMSMLRDEIFNRYRLSQKTIYCTFSSSLEDVTEYEYTNY